MGLQNAAVDGDGTNGCGSKGCGNLTTATTAATVLVNGTRIANMKSPSSVGKDKNGKSGHGHPNLSGSSSKVFAEGILVHRGGDGRTCGHVTIGSSGNVLIG